MQSCAKSWGVFLAKSVNPSAPCRRLSDKSRVVWKLPCRIPDRCASLTTAAARGVRTSAAASSRQIERILPRHDDFAERHIGPGEREKREMLDVLGLEVRFTAQLPLPSKWAYFNEPAWKYLVNIQYFIISFHSQSTS